MEETRNAYRILMDKCLEKRIRWEDSVKMYFRAVGSHSEKREK
jgi:hypothetical protein